MRKIDVCMPIKIGYKILLPKNIYENKSDDLQISFICNKCMQTSNLLLSSQGVDLLDNLFLIKKIIDKKDLISNGIAKENSKIYSYLGELSIFPNLPALYNFIECSKCNTKYIIVFSVGESQPGRNIFFIGGIWNITYW